MTRVCLVGDDDVELRYELVSRETAREALSTYDLTAPYENTVALGTVSLGAAVSILNDLDWYLARFVAEALVFEPSISDEEWLSRSLASAVRDGECAPEESGRYLKVFGVADGELLEPMFVTRTGPELPEYDLNETEETLVVRVTETEFGA
ncbi:hypothetical protein KM295_07180 [Natronomonas sp. F2-12]|jgi:hypothetical protein|uniref:Uncharacterized protein n=1 Tax=Natronomonas aquatica TaxID=2841590 RepID=A0A9R1D7E8_9EURY|nr:DUF5804 family protein [Natronomonas aquatica]MCQ4333265.1 hypothetical protein [Natronomonas aquatica]